MRWKGVFHVATLLLYFFRGVYEGVGMYFPFNFRNELILVHPNGVRACLVSRVLL